MRQQMQENTQSFIDDTLCILSDFKNNDKINTQTAEQQEAINNHTVLLNGEKTKVRERELVVAVVGTMKAGKSTTINSIVGSEILPNRNEAITSLPTLISHVKTRSEPLLTFPHAEPVNILISQLRSMINKSEENTLRVKTRFKGMAVCFDDNFTFETSYEGQQAIFDFLRVLNDIVRVAAFLEVPFPYHEYASVENLPRIEVAFSTLEKFQEYDDKLTLLDTPGPNEAGQEHFKPMLDDQLKKSSAVITVIDYTQLNSISENELRQTILSLIDSFVSIGRSLPVYAIVNKFDNKDDNSLDEDGVKRRVSDELFERVISRDQVLPYSAQNAFRANVGLSALAQEKEFDPELAWVSRLKGSIGTRLWARLLADKEALKEHFEDQLDDSLFEQMINVCVIDNYNNVLPQVLRSALNKSLIALDDVRQPLNILFQAVNIDSQKLQAAIEHLKYDLNEFSHACDAFDQTLDNNAEVIEKGIKRLIKVQNENAHNGWAGFKWNYAKAFLNKTFETKEEAEQASIRLHDEAFNTLRELRKAATLSVEKHFDDVKKELAATAKNSVDKFRDKIFDNLKDNGIDASEWKPVLTKTKLGVLRSIEMTSAVDTEKVGEQKRRRVEGVWGGICGLFKSDDWGWEDYTEYHDVYCVNCDKLLAKLDAVIDNLPEELSREAVDIFEIDIRQNYQLYHNLIIQRANDIKDNMVKSIELKENKAEDLNEVKETINAFNVRINDGFSKAELIKEAMTEI